MSNSYEQSSPKFVSAFHKECFPNSREQSSPKFVSALHKECFPNSCEQSSPELDRIPPAKHPECFPISTGKHMICDLSNIRNLARLESMSEMHAILTQICTDYDFTVLNKIEHLFHPQGISVIYMLSESHISVHTFPENRYLALDIYTCRNYNDDSVYKEIYKKLVDWFECDEGVPIIISRGVHS